MNNRLRFNPYKQKNWLKSLLRPTWTVLRRLPHQARLLVTRTVVRLFPFASIDPDRLYPPAQICESTPEWVSSAGQQFRAKIRDVDVPCTVPNPLPKTAHQTIRRQFLMDQAYDFPETFVATLPEGRVTNRGFVITPDRQLLKDVSTYFYDPSKTIIGALSDDWTLGPLTEIDGRVAVLATDGAHLYYHWLFQLLPRYELIRRAGIELADIDFFFVNSQTSRFQRDTLTLLGIDASKIIDGDRIPHLRARELIVPSVPLGGGCFRPWMTDFLRKAFLPKNLPAARPARQRFYISRGRAGYRRVLNEGAVMELLHRHEFRTVEMETLSVQEQAAAMASCEAVVAPHGGGLSNVVFCSRGTKIIEIFSPELVATYFWKLSNQLNLDYYYLLGKGSPDTLETDYPQSWDARVDIEVDLELLERTLTLANL